MPIEICGMLLPVMDPSAATPARIGGQRAAGGLARGVELETVDLFARAHEESWIGEGPVDFEGEYYKVCGAFSGVRAVRGPHVPLYGGGGSDLSIDLCAKHCDLGRDGKRAPVMPESEIPRLREEVAKRDEVAA